MAQITNPAPYCKCEYSNDYNMFSSVTVNGGTHNTGAMGNVGTTVGYRFFNTQVFPNINIGADNTISILSYSVQDGEPLYFAVYIDINHNNTFDANEVFLQNNNTINAVLNTFGTGGNTQNIAKTFMIPATAIAGQTRMRIVRGQHTSNNLRYGPYDAAYTLASCRTLPPPQFPGDPGGDNSYGICYDYNVNLTGGLAVNDIEQQKDSSIEIYPNPVKDLLMISNPKKEDIKKISIYSASGQVVLEKSSDNGEFNNGLNVSNLLKGTYFIKIETSKGKYTDKLSKQ